MGGFPRIALLLTLLSLLAGCVGGSRYQITMGNGHALAPVMDVALTSDEKRVRDFEVIAPQKVAATKPRGGKLPGSVRVAWRDAEGNPHEESLPVASAVRPDFRGQLHVEISEDNQLSLTAVESPGKELSTMPWAMPEDWEGSVVLPGME